MLAKHSRNEVFASIMAKSMVPKGVCTFAVPKKDFSGPSPNLTL
jgi:hypothetical protein